MYTWHHFPMLTWVDKFIRVSVLQINLLRLFQVFIRFSKCFHRLQLSSISIILDGGPVTKENQLNIHEIVMYPQP